MRVAVLLSGGVDSSVALHRLLRGDVAELGAIAPRDIVAYYLKIWLEDELAYLGECPWQEDLAFARAVCRAAGVELEVVSLQRPYHHLVIESALGELRAGRTPSPDVWCNRRVKFGAFADLLASTHGTPEWIASGHYARRRQLDDGSVHLLRGVDPVKDQTYFLFRLEQEQLRRSLFPLGGLRKDEVRALAAELGLPNRGRPDSQGLCFLGGVDFRGFVRARLGERPGAIRRVGSGEVLGSHRGHWFYTVGQRKGLGLGGGPWYVVGKDVRDDVVWVTHQAELPRRSQQLFLAGDLHWIAEPFAGGDAEVRLRHGPRLVAARCRLLPGGLEVELARPDPGVAPGQAVVVYRGEVCLGGGWIR